MDQKIDGGGPASDMSVRMELAKTFAVALMGDPSRSLANPEISSWAFWFADELIAHENAKRAAAEPEAPHDSILAVPNSLEWMRDCMKLLAEVRKGGLSSHREATSMHWAERLLCEAAELIERYAEAETEEGEDEGAKPKKEDPNTVHLWYGGVPPPCGSTSWNNSSTGIGNITCVGCLRAMAKGKRAEAETKRKTCGQCSLLPPRKDRSGRLWSCGKISAHVHEGSGACVAFSQREAANAEPARPDVWAVVGKEVTDFLTDVGDMESQQGDGDSVERNADIAQHILDDIKRIEHVEGGE